MLNFEYFSVSGATVANGIFIPIENLPGLNSNELNGDPITQDCKFTLAILSNIESTLTADNLALGLTLNRGIPVGVAPNVFNQNFILNTIIMGNYKDNTLSPVPAFTSLYFSDLFPDAKKLAAQQLTGGAGVLIPSTELVNYGAQPHATTDMASDIRGWCFALINYLINNIDRRASNERSAIISATKGNNTILVPPANYTSGTAPLTSLLPSDLPLRVFLASTYNIVIQMRIHPSAQSYDVAVVSPS